MHRAFFLLLLALPAFGGEPVELTIFHTNDIHGYALAVEASWIKVQPRPKVGGFLALEAGLQAERAKAKHHLLLDAGDILTGQVSSTFPRNGVIGGYLIEAMNLVGYDAGCVGNHEFDAGVPNMDKLVAAARFPFLAANLVDKRKSLKNQPYKIFERGGLKIAVIGGVTRHYRKDIPPSLLKDFDITPMAEALPPLIAKLRPQVHLIVLLTHAGLDEDLELARALKDVDVIVGGHSHTRLQRPKIEQGKLIVQAGCYLQNLGVLKLWVDADEKKVIKHEGRLRLLNRALATKPSPKLAALMAEVRAKSDALMKEHAGTLAGPLTRNYHAESSMGSAVADAFRATGKTDIAFINSGGLRTDLPGGKISKGTLMAALPFNNRLCTFSLTGKQLLAVLTLNAKTTVDKDHGILHISGATYHWNDAGMTIVVGGKPFDISKSYSITSNSYIATGQPMKYLGFAPTGVTLLESTDIESMMAHLAAAKGPLAVPPRGRFGKK